MGRVVSGVISPALAALRTAVTDPDIARIELSWLAVNTGKWAFLVTNLVIAYEAGGAAAVGILGLARYLTPTLIAPFAGLPTARWSSDRVLVATNIARAFAVVLSVLVIASGAPIELLVLTVALEAGFGAFTRPLTMAILPSVARTPGQLVGANVTASAAEGLGTFLGPLIGGVLLATSGPMTATLAVVVIYVLGVVALTGLHVGVVGRSDGSVHAVLAQLMAGIRTVAALPGPRLVVTGIAFQTFVRGLLTVLTVVAAIELLGMGEPGVGALNAAMGAGGIIGAVLAITLAGRPQLAPAFGIALAAWGAPIAVIGIVAVPAVALTAMVVIGTANALLDVAAFTLAQRTAPNASRVAVMGLIDSVANAGVALGGILAPVLIAVLGVEGALIATGLILPVVAVALWPGLRRVDEGTVGASVQTGLLRGVPLFAPLSLATVEYLAGELRPVAVPDDTLDRPRRRCR